MTVLLLMLAPIGVPIILTNIMGNWMKKQRWTNYPHLNLILGWLTIQSVWILLCMSTGVGMHTLGYFILPTYEPLYWRFMMDGAGALTLIIIGIFLIIIILAMVTIIWQWVFTPRKEY